MDSSALDDVKSGLTEQGIIDQLYAGEQEAETFRSSELANRQAAALDAYDAQPYGDEQEGLSQYIEPVVAEVVDDMTVAIMEAFVSGDDVVEFEAGDTDDSESGDKHAAEATALVQYYFMKKQDGERVMNDWFQSGANEVVGFVKVYREEETYKKREQVTGPESAVSLMSESDVENVKGAQDNGDGTWTLDVVTEERRACFKVVAIPSEEFLFSPMLRSLDERRYKAHVTYPSISDLIAMGFDRDQCENLPEDQSGNEFRDLRASARWREEGVLTRNRRNETGNNRKVRLLEEYDYFDLDGTGVTELVQVFRVEKEILKRNGKASIEPWDDQPFVDFCPYPRAHKLVGDGLAEKVMPDQRLETVITRQMLDGIYASNSPRLWLPDESITDDTIADLLEVGPQVIVRGRGSPPTQINDNFDIGTSQNFLADLRQRRQSRTGILNLSKGMDKDALNDTMGGQAQLMTAGEKKQKYVARNFARSLAKVFFKLMRLIKEEGQPVSLKVEGKYTQIDPSRWPDEMDWSLKVGLGSNGKEQRLAHRMTIAQLQSEALMAKLPIVGPQEIYNTGSGLIRDMALGEPSDYWINPKDAPPQQGEEKPDPETMKAQAEMQMMGERHQFDMQAQQAKQQSVDAAQQAKLRGEQDFAQQRMDLAAAEASHKADLARQAAETDAQLARDKAEVEADLARRQFEFESEMAQQRMALEAAQANHSASMAEKMHKNRPGGDLSK